MNSKNEMNKHLRDAARSVHLSAAAGSGKTRALTERYIELLELLDRHDLGMDQAVAITFTEKAAAEIKKRVMHDLRVRSNEMLRKIVRGKTELRISTIHSFCMNILKRYPLEAGLPPDFGVLDARDQAFTAEKAIEDAIEEADRIETIMKPLSSFAPDKLIEIMSFLLSIRSRIKRLEIDAGGPERLLALLRLGMRTEESAAEAQNIISDPKWHEAFSHMASILKIQEENDAAYNAALHEILASAKTPDSAYDTAELLSPVYFNSENNPKKRPAIPKTRYIAGKKYPYKEYEEFFSRIQDMLSRFLRACRCIRAGHIAESMLALYLRAEEKYSLAKLRKGVLDFDDLEIFTYRLLKGVETLDILYRLDRKILHFLVDEFQDTSDIQWAVFNALTEEIFSGHGADKPIPPTLFVVGDKKQSIYRFREANYRLIDKVKKRMEENIPSESLEVRTLDRNFRSVPEVIETVNKVFSALWGEAYTPAEADRAGQSGTVKLIEITNDAENIPTEAAVLAREIRAMVESGTIVYDKLENSWKKRAAQYNDCAVLIQSRTKLKQYEAALREEDVPFRVVGGIGFYEEDEIQAIINTLFFLWNRDDRLSFAAALSSPLFGLSDIEMAQVFYSNPDPLDALRTIRPETWSLFNDWYQYAGTEPLAGMVHRIIRDTGAYVRFGRRNHQAIFNLDKLLDTVREFDRRGHTMLQDFVEWVKNIRATEQREATADMNLPGFEGAVSIMTVHKAKGLEFPVVFLPGMNQSPRSLSARPPILLESDNAFRMAVNNKANPVHDELWEKERAELKQEHQRLLYVAMTRARDHLIMLGTLNNGANPVADHTWLGFFRQAAPAAESAPVRGKSAIFVSSYPDWEPHPSEWKQTVAESRQTKKEAHIIDPARVLLNIAAAARSETTKWKKTTDFISEEKERIYAPPDAGSSKVAPITRGSFFHRCLEDLTTTGAYDLKRTSEEFPEIYSLDKHDLEVFLQDAENTLQALMKNEELAWIFRRQPSAYSELPFLLHRKQDVVSGVIDRVVIKDKRGYVVDYKAIAVESEESLQFWMNHYRTQIQIYCEAVHEIFRLDSVEGYLLFLDSGRLALTARL